VHAARFSSRGERAQCHLQLIAVDVKALRAIAALCRTWLAVKPASERTVTAPGERSHMLYSIRISMPRLRAERFADSAQKAHSAPSRWLLEVMIRDHASTLEAEASGLKGLLDSLLQRMGSSLGTGDAAEKTQSSSVCWTVVGAGVFDCQQEVEILVHQLFTAARETTTAASRLHARLTALQKQTRLLAKPAAKSIAIAHSEEIIP